MKASLLSSLLTSLVFFNPSAFADSTVNDELRCIAKMDGAVAASYAQDDDESLETISETKAEE